jgi:hypothetical protein
MAISNLINTLKIMAKDGISGNIFINPIKLCSILGIVIFLYLLCEAIKDSTTTDGHALVN